MRSKRIARKAGARHYRPLHPWVERAGARLLIKHGLADWTLSTKALYRKPDDSTVLGSCCHGLKSIVIRTEWTQSRYRLRNTILHEIAHALVGFKAGHGLEWQAKALELGVSSADIRWHTNL